MDSVNQYMLSLIPGDEKVYFSFDSICKVDADVSIDDLYTPKFLNSIRLSGHHLKLKVGAPIMLLRNIDKSIGLCNGTRFIVSRLGKHVIEAIVTAGSKNGVKVTIPRMAITPSNSRLSFKLRRILFLLAVFCHDYQQKPKSITFINWTASFNSSL